MTGFHNIHGEPIDWRVQAEKAGQARRRGETTPARKPTFKNGYAAQPGTGPEGKTCGDCKFKRSMSNTGKKHWIKCEVRRETWTGGEGTDILARSPACRHFAERQP